MPADLHWTGDQVGLVNRQPRCFAFSFPAPLHGHATQHCCLTGASGGTAGSVSVFRRVPEIAQHIHAARLDFSNLWVFIFVDDVLVDTVIHQLVNFRLDPGLAESRQVLP